MAGLWSRRRVKWAGQFIEKQRNNVGVSQPSCSSPAISRSLLHAAVRGSAQANGTAMTCLHHFDTLTEIKPHDAGRRCSQTDPSPLATTVDLTELARLLASILSLAESVRTPWRPRTMEQWLT
jgi:hypothetical protein